MEDKEYRKGETVEGFAEVEVRVDERVTWGGRRGVRAEGGRVADENAFLSSSCCFFSSLSKVNSSCAFGRYFPAAIDFSSFSSNCFLSSMCLMTLFVSFSISALIGLFVLLNIGLFHGEG